MVVLSFLKENVEKNMITREKRGRLLYSVFYMQMTVFAMLVCMFYSMLTSEEYKAEFSHSFDVYFVKLPCAIALHLCLYPEVAAGMNIMKVANQ